MRHVLGIVLAVVMALAVFFGGSWGYLRLLRIPAAHGPVNGAASALPAAGGSLLHDKNVLLAFAALAAVALLAGILVAVPRISPLAAGLPGLLFITWTVVYGIQVQRAARYIPLKHGAFGDGFEALLVNGVLAAAGIVLVIPLFVPSRWRRRTTYRDQGGYYGDQGGYYGDQAGYYGDQAGYGGQGAAGGADAGLLSDWSDTAPYPQPPTQPPPP